ncbi:MAG: hypothetical protein IT563_22850 [Alphaproteobacteria bacterium]|nr:hypothetical protein [Alphaproteobacteria bacterium]
MKNKPESAAEFLANLRRNQQFAEEERQREQKSKLRTEELKKEEAAVLADLRNVRIFIESVWDLVNSKRNYPAAIPVLVRHLALPYSIRTKEGIARALSVEYAGTDAFVALVQEFRKQNDDSEIGLKWVLGNAIATVARHSEANALISLVIDPSHGKARDMIILALPRVVRDKTRLREVLLDLAADECVGVFAKRAMESMSR